MSFEKILRIRKWLKWISGLTAIMLVLEVLVVILYTWLTKDFRALDGDLLVQIFVPTALVLIVAEIVKGEFVW